MIDLNTLKKPRAIALGDNHGCLSCIYQFIKRFGIYNTVILQCGDFGYSFKEIQLTELNNYLVKTKNYLLINRGNHDNPHNHFFTSGREYSEAFSNLQFVEDYKELTINNLNYLFIGGATSIDRKKRERNISYWENEKILYNIDFNNKSQDNLNTLTYWKENIDIVVSHTAPTNFSPQVLNPSCQHYIDKDPSLTKELEFERRYLENIFKYIQPKYWIHGHFHISNRYRLKDTNVISLGAEEFYELNI
jgi:predicted phosphodiesterase